MATHSYRGVQYEFVGIEKQSLDELKCPVCLQLVSDPVQTSCGHLFCDECMEGLNVCPIDDSDFTLKPDHLKDARVCNLKVKCPHKQRGCQWQGKLGEVEKHIEIDCERVIVECKHVGCNLDMERGQLLAHMNNDCLYREYTCPFCGLEDTYCKITTAHFTICQELPLPCPGGCGSDGLVRRSMSKHLSKECPEEFVSCSFVVAGCKQIVKRKELQQHLQDKDKHLDIVLSNYISLSRLVQDLLIAIKKGDEESTQASHLLLTLRPWLQNIPTCYPCVKWVIKMEGFQEKKENNYQWVSDPVYSHFGGYKMCLRVDANGGKGTYVSLFVLLMRGDNDDNLKWPFKGTIKVCLLNQLEDRQHHSKDLWSPHDNVPECISGRVTDGEEARKSWGCSYFISHQKLGYCRDKSCQYLKNDNLFFRVERVEPKLD